MKKFELKHRSNPQTPNYKREPFATLSGKRTNNKHVNHFYCKIGS